MVGQIGSNSSRVLYKFWVFPPGRPVVPNRHSSKYSSAFLAIASRLNVLMSWFVIPNCSLSSGKVSSQSFSKIFASFFVAVFALQRVIRDSIIAVFKVEITSAPCMLDGFDSGIRS